MTSQFDQGFFVRRPSAITQAGTSAPVGRYNDLLIAVPVAVGIVIAMALGSSQLTTLVTVTALGTALVAPHVGLAILAYMAPLVPPSIIPAPGFDSALVAAILLGCLYRLPIDRPQLRIGLSVGLMIAFVLYVTVQQLPELSTGYGNAADHAVGYLYLQLMTGFGAILAAIWVLRGRSPFPVLAMAIAGAVTAALIALVIYFVPASAGALVNVSGVTLDPARAVGTFSNPNFMGGMAAVSMTAATSLMAGAKSRRIRGLLLACAVILGGAVIVTLSRGALITAIAGLVAVGLTQSRRTAIMVVVVGLVGVFIIYPAFVNWRLTNILGSASAAAVQVTAQSDLGRLTGALAGISLFLSSPLVGVGFGHFFATAVQIPGVSNSAHNWYTYVLGEQGVVGALLFVSVLASLAPRLRSLPSRPRSLGVSVLAAFATACLFLEVPTSFQTFAIPAICIVAALVGQWPLAPDRDAEDGAPMLSRLATE